MKELTETLFGQGESLDPLQMTLRGVAIFVLTLAMIRISGRRSFGQQRPFDACTTVLLGSVLSRAVVGASPFWATVCAGGAIVAMHRLVAMASMRWAGVDSLVSGNKRELVRDGVVDRREMRRALVTRHDIDEAIRKKTGDERQSIERAVLERDGVITVKTSPDGAARGGDGPVAARP